MLLSHYPNSSTRFPTTDHLIMPSSAAAATSSAGGGDAVGLQSADLRRIFHQLDKNRDGFLSIDELSWLLDRIGSGGGGGGSLQFTVAELESSIGKSSLDFEEFIEFYESISGEKKSEEAVEKDLEEAFRVFDLNGDGFITSEELQKVLERLGLWDEAKDCGRMICVYDTNRDGVLDFGEFKRMMMVNRTD
ncbi:Probable calcium-binding protein CML44 [Linum grandiflorum]